MEQKITNDHPKKVHTVSNAYTVKLQVTRENLPVQKFIAKSLNETVATNKQSNRPKIYNLKKAKKRKNIMFTVFC